MKNNQQDISAPQHEIAGVLAGKVALITGGASGIGFAIAQRFAAAGCKLVVSSRNTEHGINAENALRQSGADVLFAQADIAREDDVRHLIDVTLARFGRLDILINNAGPSGSAFGLGPIHELATDVFEQTMRVGVYGPLWCCKYALPYLRMQRGVIVNISALTAIRALPLMGAYAMAKAALEALTRQVANDYADDGIRCNSLMVGTVRPEANDISTLPASFDHAALDVAIAKATMLNRVGSYANVAEAALFLASHASQYITGASIPVEGGALAKIQYPDYRTAF
ncbi:MAG: hypothetical protein JWM78_3693 [Verrucomicrobiaceae bacterium]|nr:hypothetical protein [Verrucomicrobiaceae bacterium]